MSPISSSPVPPGPSRSWPRILVVEDSRLEAAVLGDVLAAGGFEVEHALDGESGLRRLRSLPFHLVLSDVMMPGLNGFDLCRAIRSDPGLGRLPVILLTSLADIESVLMGLEAGADNFIVKPFDKNTLLARIHDILASGRTVAGRKEGRAAAAGEATSRTGGAPPHVALDGRTYDIQADMPRVLRFMSSALEDLAAAQAARLRDESLRREMAREHEGRLFMEASLDALSAHLAILDESGRIMLVNRAWREFQGDTPLAGQALAPGEDYLQACETAAARGFEPARTVSTGIRNVQAGETQEFYTEYCCPSMAGERWYITRARPFPGRPPLRVILQHADSTARKRAEQALEAVRQSHEEILNSVEQGILGLDLQGRITFVNLGAATLTGLSRDQILGRKFHDVLPSGPSSSAPELAHDGALQQALQTGVALSFDAESLARQDGALFAAHLHLSPIREGDRLSGAVLTVMDTTERMTLQRRLLQAQKMESLGQIAAGIAHEINTPTQYVGDNARFLGEAFEQLRGCLDLATELAAAEPTRHGQLAATGPTEHDRLIARFKERTDAIGLHSLMEEVPRAVGESLEGVERIASIVRAMKEFAHPGGPNRVPLDVNQALTSSLSVARNEWKYVADVVTDLDPTMPPVPCLEGELKQVLLNLIVNAAHAIGEALGTHPDKKGSITIRTHHADGWAEVQIADTGCGVPEAIQGRVFDPFFTTKGVGKGTGQGLAIAHDVVVCKHGGDIRFESKPGLGTTFYVRLPLEDSSTAGHHEAEASTQWRDSDAAQDSARG